MGQHHYSARYEVVAGGLTKIAGQTDLSFEVIEPRDFDPAILFARLQQQIAQEHGVPIHAVRIRGLNRL